MLSKNRTLLRRVADAQLNFRPAPRTVLLDGWVLRLADGYTNPAHSATPLAACRAPLAAQLARVLHAILKWAQQHRGEVLGAQKAYAG